MILELSIPVVNRCVYQCGQCGQIWAAIQGRPKTTVLVWIADCPQCGLGSLFGDPWDMDWEALLSALPRSELERELIIHLEEFSERTATTPV
jgi:hypothetical protein